MTPPKWLAGVALVPGALASAPAQQHATYTAREVVRHVRNPEPDAGAPTASHLVPRLLRLALASQADDAATAAAASEKVHFSHRVACNDDPGPAMNAAGTIHTCAYNAHL